MDTKSMLFGAVLVVIGWVIGVVGTSPMAHQAPAPSTQQAVDNQLVKYVLIKREGAADPLETWLVVESLQGPVFRVVPSDQYGWVQQARPQWTQKLPDNWQSWAEPLRPPRVRFDPNDADNFVLDCKTAGPYGLRRLSDGVVASWVLCYAPRT